MHAVRTHTAHTRCACGAHALRMRCRCAAHAAQMRCACGAHALRMRCTRAAHTVHVPAAAGGRRRAAALHAAHQGRRPSRAPDAWWGTEGLLTLSWLRSRQGGCERARVPGMRGAWVQGVREREWGGGGVGGGACLVMHPPRHVRVRREEGGVVRAVVRVVPHHRKGLVLGMVRLQSVAY